MKSSIALIEFIDCFLTKVTKTQKKFYMSTEAINNAFVLFHLYPPITRKRRWRYIL